MPRTTSGRMVGTTARPINVFAKVQSLIGEVLGLVENTDEAHRYENLRIEIRESAVDLYNDSNGCHGERFKTIAEIEAHLELMVATLKCRVGVEVKDDVGDNC